MLQPRPFVKYFNQVRTRTSTSGPPNAPLSLVQAILHGSIMFFTFMSVPMYVTYHLPIWKARRE